MLGSHYITAPRKTICSGSGAIFLIHNKRLSQKIAKPEVGAFLTLDTIVTVHSRSTYDTLTVSLHSTY